MWYRERKDPKRRKIHKDEASSHPQKARPGAVISPLQLSMLQCTAPCLLLSLICSEKERITGSRTIKEDFMQRENSSSFKFKLRSLGREVGGKQCGIVV